MKNIVLSPDGTLLTVDGVEVRHEGMPTHDGIKIAAYYADASTLVSIDVRGQIRVWDHKKEPLRLWFGNVIAGEIKHIAITPDRSLIFVHYIDGRFGEAFSTFARHPQHTEWAVQIHGLYLRWFHGRIEFGVDHAVLWHDPAEKRWRVSFTIPDHGPGIPAW